MNLKNYTSSVPSSTSMAKIEACLVEIGASNINKKYRDKICTGITFLYHDPKMLTTIAFHLRAQVDEAFNIIHKKRKFKNKQGVETDMKQANMTAWKILSDWTELQCSMILLGQAETLQLFLPFTYDAKNDETLYEKIASGKPILQLESFGG